METFSFKAIAFRNVDFLGEWRLDWSSHGQPRYKPRNLSSLKIFLPDGNVINVIPAKEQPVTITEGVIHIPVDHM
jgi:hypothetical protein